MPDQHDVHAGREHGVGRARGDFEVDDFVDQPAAESGNAEGEVAARGEGGVDDWQDGGGRWEGGGEEGLEVRGERVEGLGVALEAVDEAEEKRFLRRLRVALVHFRVLHRAVVCQG